MSNTQRVVIDANGYNYADRAIGTHELANLLMANPDMPLEIEWEGQQMDIALADIGLVDNG